jgi:hypothetical protein
LFFVQTKQKRREATSILELAELKQKPQKSQIQKHAKNLPKPFSNTRSSASPANPARMQQTFKKFKPRLKLHNRNCHNVHSCPHGTFLQWPKLAVSIEICTIAQWSGIGYGGTF